jgi:hypothetical protein
MPLRVVEKGFFSCTARNLVTKPPELSLIPFERTRQVTTTKLFKKTTCGFVDWIDICRDRNCCWAALDNAGKLCSEESGKSVDCLRRLLKV